MHGTGYCILYKFSKCVIVSFSTDTEWGGSVIDRDEMLTCLSLIPLSSYNDLHINSSIVQ